MAFITIIGTQCCIANRRVQIEIFSLFPSDQSKDQEHALLSAYHTQADSCTKEAHFGIAIIEAILQAFTRIRWGMKTLGIRVSFALLTAVVAM